MDPISVRLATAADATAYGELLTAIFSEEPQTLVPRPREPSPDQVLAFLSAHTGAPSALFLAFLGDALVGSLNLTRHVRPLADHVVSPGVNVAKDARRCGVGTTLIAEALRWAEAREFADRVELEVLENNAPAIRLYERFGFVHEGTKEQAVKRGSR